VVALGSGAKAISQLRHPSVQAPELCSGRVLAAKSNGQKVSQAKNCQCQWPVKCHVQFWPPVTESLTNVFWRYAVTKDSVAATFFPFLFPLPFLPGFFSCFGEECNGFWILCAGNGQLHFILKELSDLPHAI